MAADSPPDVLLVEPSLCRRRRARGFRLGGAGGPAVLLVRNSTPEAVAAALRAGVKAVLDSGRTGPEILRRWKLRRPDLVVLDPRN